MSHRIPIRLLPISLALLLSAQSPQGPAPAEADVLAKLVPVGTLVYVQAPSLDRLGVAMRRTLSAFSPEQADKFDLDGMLGEAGIPVSPKDVDHTKPLAFCLVLGEGPDAQPAPTFLVPASSPEKIVQSISGAGPFQAAAENGYVSISMSPDAKHGAGPAAIAQALPAGDLVARVDVKRLVEHFRPFIDMGLGQMEMAMAGLPAQATSGMNLAPVMKLYADGIRSVVDSGETLDIVLRLDGDRLEMAEALTVLDKSPMAAWASKEKTDAKALSRFLQPEAPMGIVLGMDSAALWKRLRPFLDASLSMYPDPIRTDFQKMMGSADEFCGLMGSSMCASGGLGSEGLRYALYLHPKDPAKLLAVYQTMLKSVPSFSLSAPAEGNVDGVPVTRMRIRVDAKALADGLSKSVSPKAGAGDPSAEIRTMFEKIYGKDGLAFAFATKGDSTAVVIGGDDAYLKASLAALSAPGKVPAGIARGLQQVGDLNPCFLVRYDYGRMMRDLQGLAGDAFPGFSGPLPDLSASITSWGGVDGKVWKGAMSMDLAEIGAFATAMRGAEAKSGPAKVKDGSSPPPAKKD